MPLIAVNLSQAVLSGIKEFIDSGKYLSLESFIEVACFNQMALERSGTTDLEIPERAANGALARKSNAGGTGQKKRPKGAKIGRQIYLLDRPNQAEDVKAVVSPFGKIDPRDAVSAPPAAISDEPGSDRIFGQVNRLFPMKLVCRWVLRSAFIQRAWPPLAEVADALASDAARLGSLLEQEDIAKGRKRDECLATGLPRRANSPSKDRFLSQFVARITRSGHIFPGAVCQYKLGAIQDQTLALSKMGIDFALIGSPILDGFLNSASAALHGEEIRFLLHHIKECVSQEQADIETVLSAIKTGSSTPQSLMTTLRMHLPTEWSGGETQTHVSGVVARMGELGLLRRRWHGRNVEYELPSDHTSTQHREIVREAG